MNDLSIIIPVFNQVSYTARCLDSLKVCGVVSEDQIIIIDNASTDETATFLAGRPGLRVISNEQNRGCSFAWNQGAQASTARWLLVLNNDTVVPPGCIEGLINFAEKSGFDIVSPAKVEGDLDYEFLSFANAFQNKMSPAVRAGWATGSSFMVHRRVFDKIGFFDTKLGLAGNEDDDLFRRARKEGFRLAITGRAFLHHFGSVTQRSVKTALRLPASAPLADRQYYRDKHHLNWWRRRGERFREKVLLKVWRWNELRRFGLTLKMVRFEGRWHFQ